MATPEKKAAAAPPVKTDSGKAIAAIVIGAALLWAIDEDFGKARRDSERERREAESEWW